eukprot:9237656-Pyramimonas_sp.AAC.1
MESVASIIGGYIAVYFSLKAAIGWTAAPYVLSSLLTCLVLEPVGPGLTVKYTVSVLEPVGHKCVTTGGCDV